jgi:galactokinase
MVAFVEDLHVAAFTEHVKTAYARATAVEPIVYPVEAAAGAGKFAPARQIPVTT